MRKARIFAVAAFAVTACCFAFTLNENATKAKSDRLEGIGGVDAYKAGRKALLFRSLELADAIPDPIVRERERERLLAQLNEIEEGVESVHEIGDETTIERFGNGGVDD
jgi:hypothetical protein